MHIGQTKVLYRAKQNAMLELRRANIVRVKSLLIQCAFRVRGRKLAKLIRMHVPVLEAAIKSRDCDILKDAIDKASVMWFQPRIYEDAVYILANLEKEAQIKRQLEALEKMDPEEAYDDFEETMKKVKEIRNMITAHFKMKLQYVYVFCLKIFNEEKKLLRP